jgi:translocator protein
MLRKPSFQPPDWTIPVAWLAIEAGLAFGGYRLCREESSCARDRALALWAVNVASIGGWSRLFFKQRRLGVSTFAAAALVATGTAYVAQAHPVDRKAATAGLPLVGWVTFATVLTASLWALNRRSR